MDAPVFSCLLTLEIHIAGHSPNMPILIQAPELQEFTLHFQWDWSPIFTHNLTVLDVDTEGGFAVPMDNFLALLSMNQQLRTLRLSELSWELVTMDHYTSSWMSRGQQPLDLLDLEELKFNWVQRHIVLLLLSWIQAPKLRSLTLSINDDNITMREWFTDADDPDGDGTPVVGLKEVTRDYVQLEELELHTTGLLQSGECSYMLSKMPNLHKLTLWTLRAPDTQFKELINYIASPDNNFGPQLQYLQVDGFSPRQLIDMVTPTGIRGIHCLRMRDYYLKEYVMLGDDYRETTREDFEEWEKDLRALRLLVGDVGSSRRKYSSDFLSWDELVKAKLERSELK